METIREFYRFRVLIEGWGLPITIRALDKKDAEGVARIMFKVATHKKVEVREVNDADS